MDDDIQRDQCHPLMSESLDAFLEEARSAGLDELGANLSRMFAVFPVVVTGIVEHVFQELIFQFFERGVAYLPNFGWLCYKNGQVQFFPSDSMSETCSRMKTALDSNEFSLAGWEIKLRSQGDDKNAKNGQAAGRGLEPGCVFSGPAAECGEPE